MIVSQVCGTATGQEPTNKTKEDQPFINDANAHWHAPIEKATSKRLQNNWFREKVSVQPCNATFDPHFFIPKPSVEFKVGILITDLPI